MYRFRAFPRTLTPFCFSVLLAALLAMCRPC